MLRLRRHHTLRNPGDVSSATLALLLPPSEGKAVGGDGPPWHPCDGAFGSVLGDRRHQLVEALAAASGGDRNLLGVSGAHLDRARQANLSLLGAPTLPAHRRYTGVVWDHLDMSSLPSAAKRRAADRVAVVSGLHGLVLLNDPLPDYRLKMGARLSPMGTLARWWRASLTDALAQWASGRVVVDLLPQEHRAAWEPDPAPFAALVRVDLVEHDATTGAARVVGHHAKAAKGMLARHLLESGADPRRALKTWHHPRYSLHYDPTSL